MTKTNYYAYRNWLIRLDAKLFGNNEVTVFNLNSGNKHYFIADPRDTHKSIREYLDSVYSDETDKGIGLPGLMYLSGRDRMMAKEILD